MIDLRLGDCLEVMRTLPDGCVDSVVTDPPYGLKFMGKHWDHSVPSAEVWTEVLRVLKPGGHLLAFAGTRTQHRMACRIEDAGFEIRDMIAWVYGSGFPKSHNVGKSIDREAGAQREVVGKAAAGSAPLKRGHVNTSGGGLSVGTERSPEYEITAPATEAAQQWQGWGTALKPALEPITMARKPLVSTVAANVLAHGTGALNIDGCRIPTTEDLRAGAGGIPCRHDEKVPRGRAGEPSANSRYASEGGTDFAMKPGPRGGSEAGRWPANLIHDGSDEVVALFPQSSGQSGAITGKEPTANGFSGVVYGYGGIAKRAAMEPRGDSGSSARFFYCAKADRADRNEGLHNMPERLFGMSNAAAAAAARGEHYDNGDGGGVNRVTKRQNHHPTVKPTDIMRYLCRLVTPAGGVVLDPFMGSGSTGRGAVLEGFRFIGIERDAEYLEIARARIDSARRQGYQPSLNLEAAA
jgi:DNA modification methylase